jgi:hypothetical protein
MAVGVPNRVKLPSRYAITLFLGGAALLAGLGIQVVKTPVVYGTASRSGLLATKLPATLAGWNVKDEPIGNTEALKLRAEELLNYDDFVYRRYSLGGREFAVYAAHWRPGRMPTRLVTLHTPDRCWIENGWTCDTAQFNEPLQLSNTTFPPAQRREFFPPQQTAKTHVSFWLTENGEPYDLGNRLNTIPSPLRWLGQVVRESFEHSGELLFVRVTSSRPLEEFAGDPGFDQVMAAVAELLGQGRKA